MKCQNCGKREANVQYTQVINGVKREMVLCEECARELGIGSEMNFNMSMDIPSFFGEFFHQYDNLGLLPDFGTITKEKCDECGTTYNEFTNNGRLGCFHCYEVFSDRLDPILKRIQGSNRHVGRKGRALDSSIVENMEEKKREWKKDNKKEDKLGTLKEDLKKAIKDERYEDAAKLRDQINEIEGKKEE